MDLRARARMCVCVKMDAISQASGELIQWAIFV